MSLHNLGAAHDAVRGECGLGVEVAAVGGLGAGGLARERRLVHHKCYGVDQGAVGGDLVARAYHHHVARHHVAFGYLLRLPVADDAYGLVVVDLVQDVELAVGLGLEDECQPRCQHYGQKYPDGFEKGRGVVPESEIFIECDAYRQCGRYKQYDDERVGELGEELAPEGLLCRRCEDVVAMQASALDDFGVGETGERLRVCHVKVWNFYSAVRLCRTLQATKIRLKTQSANFHPVMPRVRPYVTD